jgi:EamA domain-containing membrane protein RarD
VNYPQSPQATLAFASILLAVASISAANCLAEATAGHAKSQPPAAFATTTAIAAITAAISFVLLSALFEQVPWTAVLQQVRTSGVIPYLPSLLWSALIELPALVLFFWLVPRLSAIRLSTRYLLAPLLSILVGTALLRAQQQIQPRTWIGLALMAVSVAWLLSAPEASASLPSLSPPRSEA